MIDARKYIMNNWDGIAIKAEKGYEIVGCSAEGHKPCLIKQTKQQLKGRVQNRRKSNDKTPGIQEKWWKNL